MKKINKDFQKILILWIVSVFISWFALYSFRDISFKNTKNLKDNQNQEQIDKEYQELIKKNAEAEKLIQQKNDQDNKNNENPNNNNQITTWELSILMPKFFNNSGFTKIISDLSQQNINITLNHIKNMSQYKNLIQQSWLNNFDIYLLPSDRLQDLKLNNINIWDNPKPYFHPVFNDLVTTTENKYIPYSLDPIVNITKENINIWTSRKDIFSYTTLRKQNKKFAMPIIWWIWKNDIRLLERWQWPFENYISILQQHLNQIKTSQKNLQSSELKNLLDTENIDLEYKYDFVKFKQLYNTIQKRDTNCELFPAICLMSYNFGDIKFWFISDLDILDTYFSWNNNNFDIKSFNNTQNDYPIRGRVFVVPQDNKKINLANEFFTQYLSNSMSIEADTQLRDNTFSAINNIYNLQKTNQNYFNKYQKILKHQNKFKLIYNSINTNIDQTTIEMLKWNYNIDLYLNKTQ